MRKTFSPYEEKNELFSWFIFKDVRVIKIRKV